MMAVNAMDPNAEDPTEPGKPKPKPVASTPVPQQPAAPLAPSAPTDTTPNIPATPPVPVAPPPTLAPVQQAQANNPSIPSAGPGAVPPMDTPAAPATSSTPAYSYDAYTGAYSYPEGTPQQEGGAYTGPNVGDPSIQWFTDPITGANVKVGDLNVRQDNGAYRTANGVDTDPVGTTHTYYGNHQGDSMQRPGGPLTAGPEGAPEKGSPYYAQYQQDLALNRPATGPSDYLSPADKATVAASQPAAIAPVSGGAAGPSMTGAQGVGATVASPGSVAPAGSPGSAAGPGNQVATAPIDPANDLRGQSVLPQNGVDRFKLVQDRFQNYLTDALPQYQAKLRGINQRGAAMGRTGSGMLRTSVGNLDQATQRDANSTFSNLLSNAVDGTINDGRSDRAEYRGERAYQNGLEDQAYTRDRQGVLDEDMLKGTDFNRAMQRLLMGEQGNPSGTLTSVGNQQGRDAQDTIGSLVNGVTSRSANGGSTSGSNPASSIADWLSEYLKNRNTTPSTVVGGDGAGMT